MNQSILLQCQHRKGADSSNLKSFLRPYPYVPVIFPVRCMSDKVRLTSGLITHHVILMVLSRACRQRRCLSTLYNNSTMAYISCYMICHKSPHKASQFPGDCCCCHIPVQSFIHCHFVEPPPQSFICFICICYDLWCISLLPLP